jgi:methylated-DNA-[protein]-cysteine S-methyltransferase
MTTRFGIIDSIAGQFGYLWEAGATGPVLLASGWTQDRATLAKLVHRSIDLGNITDGNSPAVDDAVARYSKGEMAAIESIDCRQVSGPFIRDAWAALRQVPAGRGYSYTDLAAAAGRPDAVRAAAAACATNATALFVPCHRIVRRNGGLGGFRYGTETKRRLLDHERVHAGGVGTFR